MLGRASARVDENSRKRMRAALGERAPRAAKRSSVMKGKKERTTTRGTRSMDELGDHTNFIRDAPEPPETTGLHFSSLPIMLQSQSKDQSSSTVKAAEDCKDDIQMHADAEEGITSAPAAAPGNDGIKLPVSTRPQNGAQHFPPRAAPATRHSQKRIEPPSPTPVRSAPIPLRQSVLASRPKSCRSTSESAPPKSTQGLLSSNHAPANLSCSSSTHPTHAQRTHTIPAPTPLPPATANGDGLSSKGITGAVPMMAESSLQHGIPAGTATSALPPSSQTHGSRRALGMTRSVPLSSSSNSRCHSAATKKPFRPPIARPAVTSAAVRQVSPTSATSSRHHEPQRQQRQKEDGSKKGSGADPDSSFDLSFDFDPEALEAAMKKYD